MNYFGHYSEMRVVKRLPFLTEVFYILAFLIFVLNGKSNF